MCLTPAEDRAGPRSSVSMGRRRRGAVLGARRLRVVCAAQVGEQLQVIWLVAKLVDVVVVPGVEGLERLVEVQGRRRCECERWHRSGRQRAGGGWARVGSCSRTGGGELREGWVFAHVAGCGARGAWSGVLLTFGAPAGVGLCSRWWRAGFGRPCGACTSSVARPVSPATLVLVYEAICAEAPRRGCNCSAAGWGFAHAADRC